MCRERGELGFTKFIEEGGKRERKGENETYREKNRKAADAQPTLTMRIPFPKIYTRVEKKGREQVFVFLNDPPSR